MPCMTESDTGISGFKSAIGTRLAVGCAIDCDQRPEMQ